MSDALSLSRQLSVCVAMQAIVHAGPISRASIAKQTGLSKQTVSEVVRLLAHDGWIRETGRTSGHVGRSAVTYEIVPDAACIAAVDLGGTKLRAALADLAGNVLGETVEPTAPEGGVAVVRQIARLCRGAAEAHGIGFDKVQLAVVGLPGVPDPQGGHVALAPNVAGLDSFDVRAALAAELGVEVLVENDVNLAVIGEHWIGGGAGHDDLAFVALGTGIGAGLMVAGELVRGAGNAAGELGFLPFGADPFEPESLRAGALERVVASQGIRARYRARTGREADAKAIFDAAEAGEAEAEAVVAETARDLARAVAAICAVVNPAKVILGGAIGGRPGMAARVQAEFARCFPYAVEIEGSQLGAHAALAGAAAVGLGHLHTALFGRTAQPAAIGLPAPQAVRFLGAAQ